MILKETRQTTILHHEKWPQATVLAGAGKRKTWLGILPSVSARISAVAGTGPPNTE